MGKTELIMEVMVLQSQVDQIVRQFDAGPWLALKITITQLKSFFFIAFKGKTNFKELADALGITPPNITYIIEYLETQGLVSRTENPKDRRIMVLQITKKGQELINNLHENRLLLMNQLMIKMSDEDLNSMLNGLKGMLKAAEALPGKEPAYNCNK